MWNFRRFLLLTQPIAPVEVRDVFISVIPIISGHGGTGISPIQANLPFQKQVVGLPPVYYFEGLAVYELLNYGHKKEGDN